MPQETLWGAFREPPPPQELLNHIWTHQLLNIINSPLKRVCKGRKMCILRQCILSILKHEC